MTDEVLLPSETDSLRKTVQECQAYAGALGMLLIEKGLFTEREFQIARVRADRYLEDRRTRKSEEAAAERQGELQRLLERLKREVLKPYPDATVLVMLPRLNPDPQRDGVFVQVVDRSFRSDNLAFAEHQLTELIQFGFSQLELGAWLLPVTVLCFEPGMVGVDPMSLRFSALFRRANLQSASDC